MSLEVSFKEHIARAVDATYGGIEGTLLLLNANPREVAFFRYGVILSLTMVARIFGISSPAHYKEIDGIKAAISAGGIRNV
jgi:hypothetical protein